MQDPQNNDYMSQALNTMYHGRGDARKARNYVRELERNEDLLPMGDYEKTYLDIDTDSDSDNGTR